MNVNITPPPPPPRLLSDTSTPGLRPMISQPVNLLRLTLIAFSLTLLVACGGGGSGGGTASPATMMPGTDDPTPMVMLEDLPTWTITDLDATRIAVNGTAPTSMTEAQIVRAIQTRASGADTFEFSDFVGGAASVDIVCNTNFSCSGDVPNVGMLTFSLRDIEDLSLVDDMNLVGFNSNSQAVMTHRGITAIQSIAAGRQSDGTQLTFQTYGGWGTGSVFGVELLDATQGATTTERFASFSFGNNTGRNPTANATWNGVMIGVAKDDGDIVQGNATIQWDDGTPNAVGGFFNTIKNLTDGGNYSTTLITWQNIPLRNGAFELDNADGSISGNFYGDNLEEVGGIFDREGIIGAFGGVQ